MTRNYHIIPSDYSPDNCPPSKIRQLHREHPDEHNAEIVVMENGIEIDRMMYRPHLAYKYDAEIPPVPDKVHVGGETFTQILGGKEKPDIQKGAPPIYQYIYKICSDSEGEKEKEIIETVYSRWRFENVPFIEKENIKSVMSLMEENTMITFDPDKETWHEGTKSPEYFYELEPEGYNIENGPYPTVKLCRDVLVQDGPMKSYELLDEIMDWNWAISRRYGRKWIDYCIDRKYIRHVGSHVLESYRTFEKK